MEEKFWRSGLSVILILFSLPTLGADDWESTRFKAYIGNPYTGLAENYENYAEALLEIQDYLDTPSDAEVVALEEAMSKVAQWYYDRGYPAPHISQTDETGNGIAYRFYLCTPDRGQALWERFLAWAGQTNLVLGSIPARPPWDLCRHPGKYSSACGQDARRSEYFYINYDQVLDTSGKITELGYQTMAHEMMHAVYPGTGLGQSAQSCRINGWITEGIADALGYHIAWEEFGKEGKYTKSEATRLVMKRHGARPYFRTLAQKRDAQERLGGPALPSGSLDVPSDYFTSSFWRFLADSRSGERGWDILIASGGDNEIAVGLLDLGVASGQPQDWRREVEWLDAGLRGIFDFGLDQMYANFVAFFSHSMPEVKNVKRLGSNEAKLDYWTARIFDTCKTVDISSIGSASVSVDLQPLTSTCIKVKPTQVAGSVQVTFSAEGTDSKFLESLLISRADTALLVREKAIPVATPPATSSVDWRDFPQDGTKATYYIISNVASQPENTKSGKAKITVAIPGFWTNFGPQMPSPGRVAPSPVQPSFDPKAPTLKKRRSDTQEMLEKQLELDKHSLNNRGSSTAEISRKINVHECADAFVYEVCGKHLQISLSLKPGSYGQLGAASSQGGLAAQFFGSMMAASTNSSMTEAYIEELEARLDRIVGSRIQIAIPLIDYGFTGSFSNASISVSAPGNRIWRAIAPPDENWRTRLTGNVTIEVFSPTLLRGSFSGNLAEIVTATDGQPRYTPRDSVQGTFVSVSPWIADERIARPGQSIEEVADDVARSFGISGDVMKMLEDAGAFQRQQSSGNAQAADVRKLCDCDCAAKPHVPEICHAACAQEYAACD